MIQDGQTLVVVADGRHARLFVETRRGGPLKERTAWLEGLPDYRPSPGRGSGAVHDRFGHGVHATKSESQDKGERRFLADLTHRLESLVRDQRFDNLMVIAEPRALGVLRAILPGALRDRLRECEAADRLRATPRELAETLRTLRRTA